MNNCETIYDCDGCGRETFNPEGLCYECACWMHQQGLYNMDATDGLGDIRPLYPEGLDEPEDCETEPTTPIPPTPPTTLDLDDIPF